MDRIESFLSALQEMAVNFLPRLALALVVLLVGWRVIHKITRWVTIGLERTGVNPTVVPFLRSLIDIMLKILLIFSVAGIVGVDVTSFLAVMAAAGFAVGLALQGSLSNFAAGIIIFMFKPYKLDDWIEVEEKFGKVEEIQIFNTIIVTPGQKTLIIPNGQIINGIVTNYSRKGFLRIELNVAIPYEESFPKVRRIILDELAVTPKVLKEPAPEVGIEQYDSHSLLIAVRPFVHPDDYWEVTFSAYERIKKAFHENNIKVAYSEGIEIGPIGE